MNFLQRAGIAWWLARNTPVKSSIHPSPPMTYYRIGSEGLSLDYLHIGQVEVDRMRVLCKIKELPNFDFASARGLGGRLAAGKS